MFDILKRLFEPAPQPITRSIITPPDQVTKRVLLIVHNPRIPSRSGRTLREVFNWNDPYQLCQGYINDLHQVSYGYVSYEIVDQIEVDDFPIKIDGFRYGADEYVRLWEQRGPFHNPDWADYEAILREFNVVPRINSGEIDEVWLHAFPQAGYYESRMVGPGAFWCNAPAIHLPDAQRRFVVMGFNFERGVGEMLESFGHRAESIMKQAYSNHQGARNMWERFIRYDKNDPGRSGVGNVHFAPNSERDYDWGNSRSVVSCADDWLNYPNLTGATRTMTCRDWGNGDTHAHHKWWLERFPHADGSLDGILNNWWVYTIDPNMVR